MRYLTAIALLLLPAPLAAQSATIAPGMSRAKVVAAFGEPATIRSAGDYTYLFFRNGCGRACGMNDLVVLRRDSVVDAILRAPARHYSGTSSSPAPLSRTAARKGERPAPARPPAAPPRPAPRAARAAPAMVPVSGPPSPQMRPGPPRDTRPSIPAGEPPVRSRPASDSSIKPHKP